VAFGKDDRPKGMLDGFFAEHHGCKLALCAFIIVIPLRKRLVNLGLS